MDTSAFNIDPSATTAFQALDTSDKASEITLPPNFKATVLCGGTGGPVSIKALLTLGVSVDSVVAMADDGGSTGNLRESANILPPGDIRKCLCAFAENPDDPIVSAFKYRFPMANNHSLGNLMISALSDTTGSFLEAIEICEKLISARGHVYPSTLNRVYLESITKDGKIVDGQASACKSRTALKYVCLLSDDGEISAYAKAIEAIQTSDLIVLGPGSLFTSIIPNLLVPGIIDAISESSASVCFICGIADIQGETWGMSAFEHLQALYDHGMEGLIDYCLIHARNGILSNSENSLLAYANNDNLNATRDIAVSISDIQNIQASGPVAIVRDFASKENSTWHSPVKIIAGLREVINLMIQRKAI